jgi:hypothetical protein
LERLPLSRVEVSRQQAQKKICWDFVHALLELAVWLQAGEDRVIAAGSKVDKKTGAPPLLVRVRNSELRTERFISSYFNSKLLLTSYFLLPRTNNLGRIQWTPGNQVRRGSV